MTTEKNSAPNEDTKSGEPGVQDGVPQEESSQQDAPPSPEQRGKPLAVQEIESNGEAMAAKKEKEPTGPKPKEDSEQDTKEEQKEEVFSSSSPLKRKAPSKDWWKDDVFWGKKKRAHPDLCPCCD